MGVNWRTVYRYRDRLQSADVATAVLGRTRGWKPPATRLSVKQEQAIEEAINAMRKKPGPVRVVDLVEEVGARCRLLRVPCPSRPAIDRRRLAFGIGDVVGLGLQCSKQSFHVAVPTKLSEAPLGIAQRAELKAA